MKRNAFTLIEVMIVIAIIGLLTAIAIPPFLQYRMDTRLHALHLKTSNDIAYNPLTGEVVEISKDRLKIIKKVGIINIPLDRWIDCDETGKLMHIDYELDILVTSFFIKSNMEQAWIPHDESKCGQ